jgi:hypothetical protein
LSGWSVSFTPYGWLTFINGPDTVKGRTVDLSIDPSQLLSHLERMPWFSYLELRRGKLAIYNDVAYANIGLNREGVRSISAVNGTLGTSVGLNFEQAIVETGIAYELARSESGGGLKDASAPQSFTAIDLIAGARYWHQSLDVSFDVSGTADLNGLTIFGNRAVARSGSVDWVDPLVGLRIRHQLTPGKDIIFRADLGGFDAGSRYSFNGLAAYSFNAGTLLGLPVSGLVGYRALDVDYIQGSGPTRYEFNALQHGPVIGLTSNF